MGDTVISDSDVEVAAMNTSPLDKDGLTVHGNDPKLEMHYPTELDPNRVLPDSAPYLDRVQRIQSEIRRAEVENREPDLENPGPDAGNPLRSAAELDNPLNSTQAAMLSKSEPAVVVEEPVYSGPNADNGDEVTDEEEETPDESSNDSSGGSGDSGSGSTTATPTLDTSSVVVE